MTTENFQTRAVDDIIIDRENRQRRALPDLNPLADSISKNGLINPIVIDENDVLVAGESRFTAIRDILGWTHITVQLKSDCSAEDLYVIELEENVKRTDLPWKDLCAAVHTYHNMQLKNDPKWTRKKTATALGISSSECGARIDVAIALEEGDALVTDADRYSTARNIVSRKKARRQESAVAAISFDTEPAEDDAAPTLQRSPMEHDEPEATLPLDFADQVEDVVIPVANRPFRHTEFADFVAEYDGPKFNFLHCDFPYGVDAGNHKMGASKKFGGYDDSPDVYWELLETLSTAMDNVVADSAHMMFWFSMDYYTETKEILTEMGWKVNPFPLMWHKSDNSGIMPDPQRGPRRIYETAFFCSRGDRLVAQPVANTKSHPNTKEIHMSEKPKDMLQHFFRMFVDESTSMLDPTMGSGNAVVVAERMGASIFLGLERDETFYENACAAYDAMEAEE